MTIISWIKSHILDIIYTYFVLLMAAIWVVATVITNDEKLAIVTWLVAAVIVIIAGAVVDRVKKSRRPKNGYKFCADKKSKDAAEVTADKPLY